MDRKIVGFFWEIFLGFNLLKIRRIHGGPLEHAVET